MGGVVGGLLSTLLEILTGGLLDLDGLVENLLNVRAADPSSLATGAFAGRVVGDVEVSGCEVHEAKVSSVAQMNGGFAGYAQGDTRYDIVSDLLGSIVDLLTNLLNIIPGLGLGDLITLLLDSNIIKADALIPVDYLNPVISHCSVFNFAKGGVIGSVNNDYAGGFAGVMVGAIAQECSVESANPYTVTGRLYAGGFAGAMANSYAVDAAVEGAVSVSATGHEEEHDGKRSIKALAGGFTGAATVGWATDLGQGESKNSDLLTGVNGLLTGLLTSDPEAAQNLLSLVGVEESKLLGVQMKGDFTMHSSNDFAGGMVGRGDGVVIAASDAPHMSDIKLWSQKTVSYEASGRGCSIDGLRSVSADGSYAGGLGTASVGGVLNTTIGLGGYLPFNVSSLTVSGVAGGFAVTAGDACAAGGVGKATGGKVGRADDAYESAASAPDTSVVSISSIKNVSAKNNAGGFVGVSRTGGLADVADEAAIKGLLPANNLLNAVGYMIPSYSNVDVSYINGGAVSADMAGGFAGDFQSGTVENPEGSPWAVYNIAQITGGSYAGGFGGKVTSGALAAADGA